MSLYQNIYKDLPSRCMRLWNQIEESQKPDKEDLTVTTMLVVAAAGLAMPWEHLKQDSANSRKEWQNHPAFKGVSDFAYNAALKKLNGVFGKSIYQSPLTCINEKLLWRLDKCAELKHVRDVGEYGGENAMKPQKETLRTVLTCLRNALAHNNICAYAGETNNIDRLSFFCNNLIGHKDGSNIYDGFIVATTSIEGFRHLLKEWFKLISEPHLHLIAPLAIEEDPPRMAA